MRYSHYSPGHCKKLPPSPCKNSWFKRKKDWWSPFVAWLYKHLCQDEWESCAIVGKSEQPKREIYSTGLVSEAHVLTNHSLCSLLAFCRSLLTTGNLSIWEPNIGFFEEQKGIPAEPDRRQAHHVSAWCRGIWWQRWLQAGCLFSSWCPWITWPLHLQDSCSNLWLTPASTGPAS